MPAPSDQDLFDLILQLEDELLAEEMEPKQRAFHLPIKAMERLGHTTLSISGRHEPEVLQHIRSIHKSLYRNRDVAVGGVHGGVYMFRGIAAAIYVPIIFGQVGLNPFECCDLSPQQIKWLQSDPSHVEAYVATFCDIFDIGGCLGHLADYKQPTGRARSLFGLSAFQIQAAAASLCVAFDGRGAVQSSLIGAELSLKAALAHRGKTDKELKSYSHNRPALVEELGNLYNAFDLASVQARMQTLPELVPNRYSSVQPSRMETGDILMAAQFIAGEAARAVTEGSIRRNLRNS